MALPDANTYSTLGGELNNYQSPEDPTTDLDANADNEVRCDSAAASRMVGRAFVAFTGSDQVVHQHDSVWGNDVSVLPVVGRSGAGVYTVTWPASVNDARGNPHALNLRRALVIVEQDAHVWVGHPLITAPNILSVKVYRSSTESAGEPTAQIVVLVW
jgi:hypothetical protein